MKIGIKTEYRLTVDGHNAGMRLAKKGWFPIEKFVFDTEEEAETAKEKLQKYIDENAGRKT